MDNPLSKVSRRSLVKMLSCGSISIVAGCNSLENNESSAQDETSTPVSDAETTTDEWTVDPLELDREVMARYYPWHSGIEFEDSPGQPVLGKYNSRNEAVINQHIKWALEHGINQFVMSWWGPRGSSIEFNDVTIQDYFLEAELAPEMTISLSYESRGRLNLGEDGHHMPMDFENRRQLREDFRYLEDNYFGLDNYFKVEGKPVAFLYDVRAYTGNIQDAVSGIRDEVEDVYLVADIVDWETTFWDKEWMNAFDAITTYGIYLPEVQEETGGDWNILRSGTEEAYRRWALAAHEEDVDFIPMTLPGFDNSEAHDQGEKDWEGPVLERDTEEFREFSKMARKYIDPELEAISITSFNEWQEFTAVEPGQQYGEKFLKVIRETLGTQTIDHFDPSQYDKLSLTFDQTVTQEDDPRGLALMLGELDIHSEGETIVSYDVGVPEKEPIFTEGAWGPEDSDMRIGKYRWLGGPTKEAHIRFATTKPATEAVIYGESIESGISADVYFNEEKMDSVVFNRDLAEYPVSLV